MCRTGAGTSKTQYDHSLISYVINDQICYIRTCRTKQLSQILWRHLVNTPDQMVYQQYKDTFYLFM